MASRNRPRTRIRIRRPAALTAAALVACLLAASAQANPADPAEPPDPAGAAGPATVEPQVWDQLQAGGSTDFWVYLRQAADLAPARAITDRAAQGEFVYQRLTRTAAASQAGLRAMLRTAGAPHQPYWIANAVRVTGDVELLERVAARPEVAQVTADRWYELPEPAPGEAAPAAGPVEWNIDRIGAPEVWDTYGATGAGIVVGTIDSGAQFDHPALVRQYRGNLGDGRFAHDYHWHDPSGVCGSPSLVPCDNEGHGTHVLGTILGDDGAGNQIGVAPGARWIAAKGCESRTCSQGALLSSGQFMLAPTDLQGENPDPQRRPHVVNNSWGGGATTDPWYRPTVESWLAAGIFPQFAAGNTTSGVAPCGSAGNPGNLAESYAAGAFDLDGEIADFSNRGPSAWDSDLVKPDIAAPGADIRSAIPGGGYAPNSGTSMASPHVAGAVALLWSAAGALVRDIDATRDLLDRTAIDVEDLSCGGEPGDNNVWGQGRLDVLAAVEAAPRGPSGRLSGTVSDAGTGAPIAGATITIAGQARERTTGDDGRYHVVLPVGEHRVTAAAFGYQPQTAEVTITEDGAIVRDLPLQPVPQVTVSGRVTDGSGHGWPLYASVAVPGTPVGTFTDPVTGRYRLRLPSGEDYQVRAVPQYPGYASATGTVPAGDQDLTLDLAATVESCAQAPGYQPGDGECRPVSGGLVLGQVIDANTGDPVTGATVAGVAHPDEAGRSVATPDDPAVGDGFYWLFSSRTGRTGLAATARHYAGATQPAEVVADGIAEASFALAAGRLTVAPAGVEAQLRLGRSTERTVTVTNTGTAPAELDLGELPGTFEVRGGGGPPAPAGQAWRPPAGLVPDPDYHPDSPTTEGQYQQPVRPGATPSAPGDILAAWPADRLSLAWGVGFDGSEVWLSDAAFGVTANHEFTVDGTATGARHATPWASSWPADMARLGEGEMCQVAVGGDNGIHCWDPGSGAVTRAITGEFPWASQSQRGLAYRPDDDTFYLGGWNQDVLYRVAGFSHPTPGAVLQQCAFPGMGISGLAWNPTAALVWVATNTATDDIYLVDPDGCRVRGSIGHPTPGFNGGGLHLAPGGDLWLTSQPNSGAQSAAYLIESGVPDVTDLPWLATSPQRVTVPPGASRTVTIAIDSAATDQQQPGAYTAALRVGHDTPYPVEPVGVTMAVTPPPTWGKITGTVTGLDCGGERRVPFGATVQLRSRDLDAELRTDAAGGYTYWAHVRHNPVQVRVAAVDGYGPGSGRAVVRPAHPAVVDLPVRRTDGFGYTCAPAPAEYAQASTVLPITGRNDTGTIDLPFPFRFYGQTYLRAHVCSNGYLEFVGPGTSFPIGCSFPSSRIPSQARPDAAIYPYRDAQLLVDAEASIRAEAQGVAPDRRLVVEFRNLRFADLDDSARRVDFTVVLHENGDVLTQYRNIADHPRERGGSALIGIEDHTGTVALPYAFEQPVLPAGATSIRYRPPPPPEPEPGPESWAARYDGPGSGDDTVRAVAASPDGSRLFVTGQSPGDGIGHDYATVAYDTRTGEQLWAARYDGPTGGGDTARALGVSPDGSRVFVTGFGPGEGTGSDYATVAYDAGTGQQLWATRYDGPDGGGDEASALAVSPDGTQVFVTGRSIGDGTSFDYATVAYDAASGDQSWAARYDGPQPSFGFDQAFALGVSPDGGRVFVTGQSRGDGTGDDYATVAYDTADGTQAWLARYDGPVAGGADVGWAVAVSPDGSGVYVTGQSQGDGTGNDYATIGYAAADGTQAWAARYDGPARFGSDLARAVAVSPDGARVFVTGQSSGDGTGNDYATVAYDAAGGGQSWAARYDGPVSGSDLAWAIGVSPDGASVFVTGQSPGGVGTGAEYATVAYQAGAGQPLGSARYQGPVIGDSVARALAVSPDGLRVYVSGDSAGVTGIDYATLAYDTAALTGAG